VLANRDSAQIYGTQATGKYDGKFYLNPIQDPANVDLRRQLMGLEPLADYCKRTGFIYDGD
jgi:hypothetical protein